MNRLLCAAATGAVLAAGLVVAAPAALAQTGVSCGSGVSVLPRGKDIEAAQCAGAVDQGAPYVIRVGQVLFMDPTLPGGRLNASNVVFTCGAAQFKAGGAQVNGAGCSNTVFG